MRSDRWAVRRRAGRSLAGLAAVAATLAVPALSPSPAAAVDLGIRAGYYGGADADDPVPAIGAVLRVDVPGPLNLELSVDARRETVEQGTFKALVVPARATAVLSLTPGFGPYLLAGVGGAYGRLSFGKGAASLGSESAFVVEYHGGLGFEIVLGPLSLTADARYCKVGPVSSEKLRQAVGGDYDPSGWLAGIAASFGF